MDRWTDTWLRGSTEHPRDRSSAGQGGQDYPGQRLGRPEHGPGSVAGFGSRILAVFIDWLPCVVVAQLLTKNPDFSALALFAAITAVSVGITGRTVGHAVAGLRVAMLDGRRAGFGAAVIRTVLLCLVIPPLVYNADNRGLHDRAANTLVLRAREPFRSHPDMETYRREQGLFDRVMSPYRGSWDGRS